MEDMIINKQWGVWIGCLTGQDNEGSEDKSESSSMFDVVQVP